MQNECRAFHDQGMQSMDNWVLALTHSLDDYDASIRVVVFGSNFKIMWKTIVDFCEVNLSQWAPVSPTEELGLG